MLSALRNLFKKKVDQNDHRPRDQKFEIRHHFDAEEGTVLFHYTSAAAAIGILATKQLWLSDFSKMEDGSEYIYARDQFTEHYRNREVYIEETPRILNTINLVTLESEASMMIGCLTERPDDSGMWAQYADQYSGCVIGIDAGWLSKRAGVALRRVNYDPKYLKEFVEVGLMMLQTQYEADPNDRATLDELSKFFILDLFAFKDPRFQSELEIRVSRLVARDPQDRSSLIDIGGHRADGTSVLPRPILQRETKFGQTSYIQLPVSDELGSAIRSLKFGPRISSENKAKLVELASEAEGIELSDSDIPIRL